MAGHVRIREERRERHIARQRLLMAVISLANDNAPLPRPSVGTVLRDWDGNPVIKLHPRCYDGQSSATRRYATNLLAACVVAPNNIDAELNHGSIPHALFAPPETVSGRMLSAQWVPIARTPKEYVLLILAVCRATRSHGDWEDILTGRICRCHECQRFFLRKTAKPAFFCQARCRAAWHRRPGGSPYAALMR